MPLPTLSDEDRKAALAKAAEARRKRAELKAELKSGKRNLKDVLAKNNDDTVGKMKVSNVLEALPGVGKVRARKLMEKLDISASRRIRGLGAKQRESFLAQFSNKWGADRFPRPPVRHLRALGRRKGNRRPKAPR